MSILACYLLALEGVSWDVSWAWDGVTMAVWDVESLDGLRIMLAINHVSQVACTDVNKQNISILSENIALSSPIRS